MHGPSSQEAAPAVMGVPISASPLLPHASPGLIMPCVSLRFGILGDVRASDRHKICLELQGLTHAASSKLQAKVMSNVVISVILVPTRSRLGYAEISLSHPARNSGHKGTPQQDNGQQSMIMVYLNNRRWEELLPSTAYI